MKETFIVVVDGGDWLPEYYGPFDSQDDAMVFEEALIQHSIASSPEGPLRDGSTTWDDWIHVESLRHPVLV